MAGLSDDARSDVMSTVRLIPRWRLDEASWVRVRLSLLELGAAMRDGNERTAYRALDEVERLGPTRLGSIAGSDGEGGEDPSRRAPPDEVLDILNTLVHPTGGWERPGQRGPTSEEG